MKNQTLVLVDGSYHMFRAYYGMPSLQNKHGEPTGAIFGVINALRKLQNAHQSDYIGVIFDAKGKTFRSDLYPEYKATRPPMPEDLVHQIKPIHEIVHALGIPLLIIEDVEADDVIGTLATSANEKGLKTFISSNDKDLTQLVNENTYMLNPKNNHILDSEGVEKKYGVPPCNMRDYLALVGDTSDNIPGVPKVGPKTASQWLKKYHSLDNIIENAQLITGKIGENIRANLDQLALSKKLVTLKKDVVLPYEPQQLIKKPADTETLKQYYQHWEFKHWLNELEHAKPTARTIQNNAELTTASELESSKVAETAAQNDAETTTASAPESSKAAETATQNNYQIILTTTELQNWQQKLQQAEIFSLQIIQHTGSTTTPLIGLAFATITDEFAYIPLAHDYLNAPEQLSHEMVLEKLGPLLEDPDKLKLGHNLKAQQHTLAHYNIKLSGIRHDVLLQAYVLDTADTYTLESLAQKYLQKNITDHHELFGKGNKQIAFCQVDIEDTAKYATENLHIILQLHKILWPKLRQQKLQEIYTKLEIPLLGTLAQIEENGVIIDADMLAKQSNELTASLATLEQQAYTLAGQQFNLSSPNQVGKILYEDLALPILAKTPQGKPSTNESVLQKLVHHHQLPQLILDYRSLHKLKTTYTDALPKQVNHNTGRIHASYQQATTLTGRLSCIDPNLQNIPIRTEQGRRIRNAFIAPTNHLLLTADYSQIELRIMAHLSQDENLLEAFNNQQDIHSRTAAEIFSIKLEDVDNAQRRTAKAINFGLIYGMSAFGLSKQLGISRGEANNYITNYFARYPKVKNYMNAIRLQAHEKGYVETILGRCLYLKNIHSQKAVIRKEAERAAINLPMQGTAADIIKKAMIDINTWINAEHPDIKIIMQVHDELIFEIPQNKTDTVSHAIKRIMEHAVKLSVPLLVNIGIGKNWDEAH